MKKQPVIYIVDDHQEQLNLLCRYVEKLGLGCKTFLRAADCLRTVKKDPPDAIVTDLFMPEMDGHRFLKQLQKLNLSIPILVLTISDSTTDAVIAMRHGAWDFITKPLGYDRFRVTLENMLSRRDLEQEIGTILRQQEGQASFTDILGNSAPMKNLFSAMEKVAPTETPVLIEGASGVGKELVARALHHASDRREGPFVTVNCGAIPENLVESTLFGHKKGAFTGATQDKSGKFQTAQGGTLFLDEIGDLPLEAQVKLLRALQEEEVEPVGATSPETVNVRLMCATHKDLGAQVRDGRFREDLYYRVHVYPLHVPELKDRGDDITLLAEAFLKQAARKHGRGGLTLGKGAKSFLKSYPWPGNVRQLENAITRAVVSAEGKREISATDFAWLTPETAANVTPLLRPPPEKILPLKEMEARYIRQVVDLCGGNLSKAAGKLGIARGTLYRKLEGHGPKKGAVAAN